MHAQATQMVMFSYTNSRIITYSVVRLISCYTGQLGSFVIQIYLPNVDNTDFMTVLMHIVLTVVEILKEERSIASKIILYNNTNLPCLQYITRNIATPTSTSNTITTTTPTAIPAIAPTPSCPVVGITSIIGIIQDSSPPAVGGVAVGDDRAVVGTGTVDGERRTA